MSDAEAAVPPGKASAARFRETVLQAARRFKSTWFDLARLLVEVRREQLFEQWGYDSFESYCSKELHIRRQTALKLTRSYSFLNNHEPRLITGDDAAARSPAFEVVEVLAQAEERGQLSADDYRAIRQTIWDPDRAPAEVKRDLIARFPRPASSRAGELARFAQTARRLANELRSFPRIPRAIGDQAAALADELEVLAARGKKP